MAQIVFFIMQAGLSLYPWQGDWVPMEVEVQRHLLVPMRLVPMEEIQIYRDKDNERGKTSAGVPILAALTGDGLEVWPTPARALRVMRG
jgi:hypothetical protein